MMNRYEKKYFYHGTTVNLNTGDFLEPHPSYLLNNERVVYGTPNRWLALIFVSRFNDDSLQHGFYDEVYTLKEMKPGVFDAMKNERGYIYKISSENFKNDSRLGLQGSEFISDKHKKIVELEKIDSVYSELKRYSEIKWVSYNERVESVE